MKSSADIASVEASRPPTSTCAPGAKRMPLGLRRNTRPLAESRPNNCEGSTPCTRLSAIALAEGWLKVTAALAPMLKDCQSMATRSVLCWMASVAPVWLMFAVPATTRAPVGSCVGAGGLGGAASTTVLLASASATTCPAVRLPRPLAFSETAAQVRVASFQSER